MLASSPSFGTYTMNNEIIQKLQGEAVKQRLERSTAIGSKATWSTEDHAAMVGSILANAVELGETSAQELGDLFHKVYNISAFQQKLAKSFKAHGHFQRDDKPKDADGFMASLAAELAKKEGQV